MPIGRIDRSGAEKLFAGSPVPLEAIALASRSPTGEIKGFDLPATATVTLATETEAFKSYNVAGLIEGADPNLRDEVIVLSAHLDHLGTVAPVKGDGIANGALDNASGVAIMLEVARAFREAAVPPRRSVLLLAVTAEESGLIGSDYFARNPTLPASSLVANVNLDMPILTFDFTDIIALGAERSSIGEAVERAARRTGVAVTPASEKAQGEFTRSDHYRFVEQGIPSVFLRTGFLAGGEAASQAFLRNCYHSPCDDLTQAINYDAAARFARLHYEIARELTDAPERPRWKDSDFFGRKFRRGSP